MTSTVLPISAFGAYHKCFALLDIAEAIRVEVSFRNPLQIPVAVSNISLICKHSAESDESESGKSLYGFYSLFIRLCSYFKHLPVPF